jgi:hypothetical protein
MTNADLARLVAESDVARTVFASVVQSENAKITAKNRGAPENAPALVASRVSDLTKALLKQMEIAA